MVDIFKKKYNLVTEMIAFQTGDRFGNKLEAIIGGIAEAVKKGVSQDSIQKLEEIKILQDLIDKRLKMKVTLHANTANLAAIIPFYSNQNHIFLHEVYRGDTGLKDQLKFLAQNNNGKGAVNNQTAELGGIFSKFDHQVYLNFNELIKTFKMMPGECTGVLLHELGHGFYACEYSDRISSNNQILSNVAKEMSKEPTKRNVEYVYKELLRINPDTKKQFVEDVIKGDRSVLGVTAFKFTVDTVTKQLENNKYDETSFESMADNFATRFGYGTMLLTGLQKINDVYPENAMRMFAHWQMLIISVVAIVTGLMSLTAGAILVGLYTGIIGFFLGYIMFATAGEQGRNYTYDDIKLRYKRIRDQLVQQIKNRAYDVKDAVKLAKDIEFMDDLVKTTGQYRSSVDFMMNYIRPANYRAKTSIERQQLLEDLVSNDLFVQSLKLHAMA